MQNEVLEWGNSGPAYVLEKFRKAVAAYQREQGTSQEKLQETYFYFQLITETDLPTPLRQSYRQIAKAFLRYPEPRSVAKRSRIGDAKNTIRQMSADECMFVINQLTSLIMQIENAEHRVAKVRRYGNSAARTSSSGVPLRFPSRQAKKING